MYYVLGLSFDFLRYGVFNVTFVRNSRSILLVLWSQVCMSHLGFLSTLADKCLGREFKGASYIVKTNNH